VNDMQSNICSLLVHHQEENLIDVILLGNITSFPFLDNGMPKDVRARSCP
jgi:hypothetical protein